MSRAFSRPSGTAKWAPGSNRRLVLVGAIVLVFIGALGSYELFERSRLDYRFAVPESWSTTCLGSADTVAELLEWDGAEAVRPEVSGLEPSYNSYLCQWQWWESSSPEAGGQELTIEIEVNDDRPYGPFDRSNTAADGWRTDYESLSGWEHGTCIDRFLSSADASYKCIASESNLRITVSSRSLTKDSDLAPEHFGPEGKSVKDLTLEIGNLARSAFHK
jgi:hypothetical protein